jgi:hypothetical protein
MTILLVLFWVFLILGFAGSLPNSHPHSNLCLAFAILLLYFVSSHGAHFP